MYRDPFRASVTDCQVQQQLRRRHDSQPGARPGAIGFESGYFSPVYAPPAATPSRGPAEAALAAAAKSLSGGVPSVEHTPLAPADAPAALLQHSTPSNTFSERRVTSLTTDGGDDGDAVGGGGGGHGGGNGGGLALDGCRNLLVMCDTYAPATAERPPTPLPTNTRAAAERVFDLPNVAAEEPWFGIEQEYTLLDATTRWPIGWPPGGYPAQQGPYYCGVGADRMYGRSIHSLRRTTRRATMLESKWVGSMPR